MLSNHYVLGIIVSTREYNNEQNSLCFHGETENKTKLVNKKGYIHNFR